VQALLDLTAEGPAFGSTPGPTAEALAARKLSFLFGMSTFRGNAAVNADGNVVFASGGLGCVYSKKFHGMAFHGGHLSGKGTPAPNVTCLAMAPSACFGGAAATGDAAGGVCLWDACTGSARGTLPALHGAGGVVALAFSSTERGSLGSFLVSVGGDASNTLAVWQSPSGDWTDCDPSSGGKALVATACCGGPKQRPLFAAWSSCSPQPATEARSSECFDFVTGGFGGAPTFWSLTAGNASGVSGTFSPGLAPEEVTTCAVGCGAVSGPVAKKGTGKPFPARVPVTVVGGASGRVLVFTGTVCSKACQGSHGSAVTDLKACRLDVSPKAANASGLDGGRVGVVSCGLDGVVKVRPDGMRSIHKQGP